MSTSTWQEAAIVLTLVPPLIVPIVKVVLGPSGTFTCATLAPARHIA